jgi:hypothetical protein
MAKLRYTATFSDGTVYARSSNRVYTVAWRATWIDATRPREQVGFAASKNCAAPFKPVIAYAHRRSSSNERAQARKANAEYLKQSDYRVEFVEVENE